MRSGVIFFSPGLFGKAGKLLQKPRLTKAGAADPMLLARSLAAGGRVSRVKYGLRHFPA
ncbi:MAG: hypothetical protein ACM3X0_10280 [Bacteroidota bacterium]